MTRNKFIGVDLGGSHILVVITDCEGNVLDRVTADIEDRSVDIVLPLISQSCNTLIAKYSEENIGGIGIAVPGNVDPTKGCTRYLPNFGWLEPVPIRNYLRETLAMQFPISLRNDGRCAALAEYKYGVGSGSRIFAMITIGTGATLTT